MRGKHITTEIEQDAIPAEIEAAFRRGLEDVKHGRTVSVESTLAEGRRRIAEHRDQTGKTLQNDPAREQRK